MELSATLKAAATAAFGTGIFTIFAGAAEPIEATLLRANPMATGAATSVVQFIGVSWFRLLLDIERLNVSVLDCTIHFV